METNPTPTETRAFKRCALLIVLTSAGLFIAAATIRMGPQAALVATSDKMDMTLAGTGLYWAVAPFGVLAFHILVHRGSLLVRLALGMLTTLASYGIGAFLWDLLFPPIPL